MGDVSPPKTVVDHIEKMMLDDMLEELTNTPLQRQVLKKDEDGVEELVTINETQRIFWAIDFLKKFAEKRGIRLDWR